MVIVGRLRPQQAPALKRTQCLAPANRAGSEGCADRPGLSITLHPVAIPNGKPTIRITAAPPANGAAASPVETAAASDARPTTEWDDIQPARPTAT